jgi:hypothetical protein
MLFVEVDPAVAEAEPPKDARYYSSVSSRAANPNPTRDTPTPRIDGQQTRIVKTFDTLRPQPAPAPVPVTPTPVKPLPQADTPQPAAQPRTGAEAGDLAVGKPEPRPGPNAGEGQTEREATQPRERPRTLVEARAQKGLIAGERLKQEGSVARSGTVSLNVKGTPFGAYDAEIVAAIQQRWYDLIDQRGIAPRSGHVVLEFNLHHDGKVSRMRITETTVGDFLAVLCQKAVEDPAPYRPWPSDMRRLNRGDTREVKFTFYYN